jgi:ABC-2 type transport system ATP-binding protein
MLLGLLTPTSGRIEIAGHARPKGHHEIARLLNFSSPYIDLPHRLNVQENLRVYALYYAVDNVADRIAELAEQMRLTKFLKQPYGELSAGQKTRVSIAKALINKPRVLLLDEPTASLDPDMADWVRTVFETYQKESNATILMASHNMQEVERMCTSILMMQGGKIVDRGAPSALISKYGRTDMEQVFLHIARGGAMEDA